MSFTLPKKTIILWQIRILIAFAALGAAVAFFARYADWFMLLAMIIVGLGLLFSVVYVPFYIKSYKITIDENSKCITNGLLIKTTNIMPFPRLVFAQSFTTPISSFFKLKCVMLKATRGWILIPELENKDAKYLLECLMVKQDD